MTVDPNPRSAGGVWTRALDARLAAMLAGGAEIAVLDAAGTATVVAPLARHHRWDADAAVLWLRPISGGHEVQEPGQPPYAFDLAAARRRGLALTGATAHGDELHLTLVDARQVRIRPAGPAALAMLARWDSYVATQLDAAQEAELDALVADTL
jgi:hypothetical protein